MKPLKKIKTEWSANLAYVIGLLVTDGNLSKDARHISFTSKDLELIENVKRSLSLNNDICRKFSGSVREKKYFLIQFGDVNFYKFLLGIGLMPAKSKIIKDVKIPEKYFFDFLRGHFDGDGTFYSYWDPRWRSSFMFYTVFISASKNHIDWLRSKIEKRLKIKGHITKSVNDSTYQLKYAKSESLKLLPRMYYDSQVICLSRKMEKIEKAIGINKKNARVAKLVDATA